MRIARHELQTTTRRRVFALTARLGLGLAIILASPLASAQAVDAFTKGLADYKAFIADEIADARTGATALDAAVKTSDLKAAQAAWIASRAGWEKVEPITGAFFGEFDEAIDAWPDAARGYHAIEARLFAGKLDELPPLTAALAAQFGELHTKISATDFSFDAQRVYGGLAKLAYEIGETKSKGGESQFAGTSLQDIKNNVVGIEAAYEMVFRPVLTKADARLAHAIYEQIERIETLVAVTTLAKLDQAALRREAETLAVLLERAAPKLGLKELELGQR